MLKYYPCFKEACLLAREEVNIEKARKVKSRRKKISGVQCFVCVVIVFFNMNW